MNNGPFVHLRGGMGTAYCGQPAKQDQLVDGWAQVNCPYCHGKWSGPKTGVRA